MIDLIEQRVDGVPAQRGPQLLAAIRERAASGPAHFHVLVPNTPAEDHAPSWAGGLGAAAGGQGGAVFIAPASAGAPETGEQVTRTTRHRLNEMFHHVTEAGGEVDGEIGDPDPFVAIREALRGQQFDETLLSTLPVGCPDGWAWTCRAASGGTSRAR